MVVVHPAAACIATHKPQLQPDSAATGIATNVFLPYICRHFVINIPVAWPNHSIVVKTPQLVCKVIQQRAVLLSPGGSVLQVRCTEVVIIIVTLPWSLPVLVLSISPRLHKAAHRFMAHLSCSFLFYWHYTGKGLLSSKLCCASIMANVP